MFRKQPRGKANEAADRRPGIFRKRYRRPSWRHRFGSLERLESRFAFDGNNGAAPAELVELNGTVYFSAYHPVVGRELWKASPADSEALLVKDILQGSSGSDPIALTQFNGLLLFLAQGNSGLDLWKSDGTDAGTMLVKQIGFDQQPDYPEPIPVVVDNALYFAGKATDGTVNLWKSDGTASGTGIVKSFGQLTTSFLPDQLTDVAGTLFFVADDGVHGPELWKSDGTAEGTVLVADIYAGNMSYRAPTELVNVDGTLYFSTDDGIHGSELWKSDGTDIGTVLVANIRASATGSFPTELVNVGGTLYFAATSDDDEAELWKSDGTASGTTKVTNIGPGSSGSNPFELINVGGTLYFAAYDPINGTQIWKSNGTAAGTTMLRKITYGTSGFGPSHLFQAAGVLYFTIDTATGRQLWKSNGTSAGTLLVTSFPPQTLNSDGFVYDLPLHVANVGSSIFFNVGDGISAEELWRSNGAKAGTVKLPIATGAGDVKVSVARGRLTITGDKYANSIKITPGSVTGQWVITGEGLTTVQGASSFIASAVTGDVVLSMAAGDDTVTFESGTFPKALTVDSGEGVNVIELASVTVNGNLAITIGSQGSAELSASQINGNATFTGRNKPKGVASGEVTVDLQTSTFLGTLAVTTGDTDDTIVLEEIVSVGKSLTINSGSGNDDVELVNSLNTLELKGTVTLNLGLGVDDVTMEGIKATGIASVNTGGGGDSVLLRNTSTLNNLSVSTGNGGSKVAIIDVTVDKSLSVVGGTGNHQFIGSSVKVITDATWTTGAGDDHLILDDLDVDRDLKVNSGNATSSDRVVITRSSIFRNLDVRTGTGNDRLGLGGLDKTALDQILQNANLTWLTDQIPGFEIVPGKVDVTGTTMLISTDGDTRFDVIDSMFRGLFTVTMGRKNDTLNLKNNSLGNKLVLDGGLGTNTLQNLSSNTDLSANQLASTNLTIRRLTQ